MFTTCEVMGWIQVTSKEGCDGIYMLPDLSTPRSLTEELDHGVVFGEDLSGHPAEAIKNDEVYGGLSRHFLMTGKGRRPDLPQVPAPTHKLLIQLYFIKEEANTSFRELKTWLEKLAPDLSCVTESRISHRVNASLKSCLTMTKDEAQPFLQEKFDFHALSPPLAALQLNRRHLKGIEAYSQPPSVDVKNNVVVALEHFRSCENEPPIFVRKWLKILSLACMDLSDSALKSKVQSVVKKYKDYTNKKKDLNMFLNTFFIDKSDTVQESVTCNDCKELRQILGQRESVISFLEKENDRLINVNKELDLQHTQKIEILKEIQKEKEYLREEVSETRDKIHALSKETKKMQKINTELKEENSKISNTKLYYKRNIELKKDNDQLKKELEESRKHIATLSDELKTKQTDNHNLKQRIQSEQTMKSKYKKENDIVKGQIEECMYALNTLEEDKDIALREKHRAYSNNVRQLYMSLQGETNVVPSQASKAVQLVSKHLFNTELSSKDLPCPRTCLNFMDEAHHIAKQQIVERIQTTKHFTYASDGTSRQKKHYMEHHIVLDNGASLSIGYSEVPDDKADTLLSKSIDLMDELSDTYCQANDSLEKNEIFTDILSKMRCLMSDRAANMKLFNKKMLEYKKDMVGSDAAIEFLYCNAHFLIALSDATEKAVKMEEDLLSEKLGRDRNSLFNRFSSSTENSACRLIRTAADVFGPRGDEKNGCREEWLGHCDSLGIKSQFTSYRTNRFNNLFENAVAVLYHKDESLQFLQDRVSHSNMKLQSICHDLDDKRILAIITGIALFSCFLTNPYWKLMNSKIPYGQFSKHVKNMNEALERWSSDAFDVETLENELPLFGEDFTDRSVKSSFFRIHPCQKDLTSATFKRICKESIVVLRRQLTDFLPGGAYGGDIPDEIQVLLDTCPLTNLTGERMFGDLDFDMVKRKTATTYLRSTLSMWKHNGTAKYLNEKTPDACNRIMASARKHGKELKMKHKAAVKHVKETIKKKLHENELQKKEKELQDKDRQAVLLTDLLSQGGLCHTKEDLDKLMRGPKSLQKLKVEMRFRKYYMNATELRLTGNIGTLYARLCSHLGLDYDENVVKKPPQKKRRVTKENELSDSDTNEDSDINENEEDDQEDDYIMEQEMEEEN